MTNEFTKQRNLDVEYIIQVLLMEVGDIKCYGVELFSSICVELEANMWTGKGHSFIVPFGSDRKFKYTTLTSELERIR